MVREIYLRSPEDPNYEPGILEHTNSLEELLTQIRVLMGTKKGEVLGDFNFGTDIRYMVFNTVKGSIEIERLIKDAIDKYVYVTPGIDLSVKVNFGKDNNGAVYGVVDIFIDGVKTIGFLVD